jgi:hypothetical protein
LRGEWTVVDVDGDVGIPGDNALTVGEVLKTFIRPVLYPGNFFLLNENGADVDESTIWGDVAWPADRRIAVRRAHVALPRERDAFRQFCKDADKCMEDTFGKIDGFRGAGIGWTLDTVLQKMRPGMLVSVQEAKGDAFVAAAAAIGLHFPFLLGVDSIGSLVVRLDRMEDVEYC